MTQSDLLNEGNVCGQTILRIVSRGNAILAELQRLSNYIPEVFIRPEKSKYFDLIFDYSYIKSQEYHDNKIESSATLLDLDEEFRTVHLQLLERFYKLFESIYKYIIDYKKFIEDVEEGVFIQQTLESLLLNDDGKQLLTEGVYLFGVMILMMEETIPGPVRERLLMAYYRCKGYGSIDNFDHVAHLCRSYTLKSKKTPVDYPVEYFQRIEIPRYLLDMLISRLRSDDIYQQTTYYPSPDHKSAALSTQAAMIFVLLYFCPDILHEQFVVMRGIVDKHFADNWVICYYMGFSVDIFEAWNGFKAAKEALKNTVHVNSVKSLTEHYSQQIGELNSELEFFLTEGVLTSEYVLDNINKILQTVRRCNVTLRWCLLHSTTKIKKLRDITSMIKKEDILLLLLNESQFEFEIKGMFEKLLEVKEPKWEECKTQGKKRMEDLAAFYGGEKVLGTSMKDEQLQSWFSSIGNRIDDLDYHDSTLAGRKIQQIVNALEEVEQFHQVESSLQVKQYLQDTRDLLKKMIRYVNVKEEVLVTIATVGDISYAWSVIYDFVKLLQQHIKREPSLVIKIRSTFLKLATMLELPLVRITQANSPDMVSVSEYYSSELVKFVRKTLQIIPSTMFEVFNEIIRLQTDCLEEVPSKFNRAQLKDYAQLEYRNELAKATYQVSKFTEGILAMETTLVGIIQVDPKQLLEDGLRKELVRKISNVFDSTLVYRPNTKTSEFEASLRRVSDRLQGMRRSFEYIQDYINIYGLKIWQEEFSRIINFNVEQECNSFLKREVYDWQSQYQSEIIPIPVFQQRDESVNFMGRLVREFLNQTSSKKTIYVNQMSGWYDYAGKEIVGIRTFSQLHASVGVFGVTGVDKLLSFMIVKTLQKFINSYRKTINEGVKGVLNDFLQSIHPPSTLPNNAIKRYNAILSRLSNIWGIFTEAIIEVGHAQLIRRHIANELKFSCKLDSNLLACTLETMNRSVLADVKAHYETPDTAPYPGSTNNTEFDILSELTKYLDTAGIANPLDKIYTTTEPLEHIALVLFLYVIAHISKFTYDPTIDTIVCKAKNDPHDGGPLVVGILSLLKQFHSSNRDLFLAYMGQYVRAQVDSLNVQNSKTKELPGDVKNVLHFLEDFSRYSPASRKAVESFIPAYLIAQFKASNL